VLTREEQDAILKQARTLARRNVDMRRRVERSEVSPQRAKELIQQAEEDLRDLLKEVG
jgi:hypothetical protein